MVEGHCIEGCLRKDMQYSFKVFDLSVQARTLIHDMVPCSHVQSCYMPFNHDLNTEALFLFPSNISDFYQMKKGESKPELNKWEM